MKFVPVISLTFVLLCVVTRNIIRITTMDTGTGVKRSRSRRLSLKMLRRQFSWTSSSRTQSMYAGSSLSKLTADKLNIKEQNHMSDSGVICDCRSENDDGSKPEQREENDRLRSFVRMRVKPSRTSEDMVKHLSMPVQSSPSKLVHQGQTVASDGPVSRRFHHVSMSGIGFGKLESYTKLDKLGEGTYATVFKGKSQLTDSLVALKEIRLEYEEGAPCTAIREVSLLRNLKHANIVTLHDIIHTNHTLTIVFEYLERDLKQYMDACSGIMHMSNVMLFVFQILRGLAYCHKRRVLHRDLKPQNLLVNQIGELKLADFGLARAKSFPTKTYSNEVVTLWYRPPDILLGSTDYSTPIDMWGVGCVLFEMATGQPLFPGSAIDSQLELIFRTLGTPTESSWPGVASYKSFEPFKIPCYKPESLVSSAPRLDAEGHCLLGQLLMYDVTKRVSAEAAMKHAYFDSLGPAVKMLPDTASVFCAPGIALHKDPGQASLSKQHKGLKSRRQSMLF